MKNFYLKMIIVLVCVFALASTTVFVFAEEGSPDTSVETSVETSDETTTEPSIETIEDKTDGDLLTMISELTAKVNSLTQDNLFFNEVLPIIMGIWSAILSALAMLIPWLKNNAKYKQLQGAYKVLTESYSDLNTVLTSTDPEKIREALSNVVLDEMKEQMQEALAKVKIDYNALGEVKAQTEILISQVKALCGAANIVWHGSAEATAILNAAPTAEAVAKAETENIKLKEYIRQQYGDAGEEKIAEITAG